MKTAHIFLTGGTGNVGSRVLARCLPHEELSFTVLAYGRDRDAAREQIRQAVEFWGGEWTMHAHRVAIITGDITQPKLGLPTEEWDALANKITHIVHCAANFRLDLSLEEARQNIVFGTTRLMELGDAARAVGTFRHFHFISTEEIGVALSGEVKEEFLPLRSPTEYWNTYEYAKAEAEIFLEKRYREANFPVTVYRPAMIVGDSQTGKILNPQGFYYIVRDMFHQPKTPFIPVNDVFQVNVIAIDVIAEILFSMLDDDTTIGRVYHLGLPKETFLTLPKLLGQLQAIHESITGERLSLRPTIAPRIAQLFLSLASFFAWGKAKEELLQQKNFMKFYFLKASFETSQMADYAKRHDITLPELQSYLPTLYRYYLESDKKLAPL